MKKGKDDLFDHWLKTMFLPDYSAKVNDKRNKNAGMRFDFQDILFLFQSYDYSEGVRLCLERLNKMTDLVMYYI